MYENKQIHQDVSAQFEKILRELKEKRDEANGTSYFLQSGNDSSNAGGMWSVQGAQCFSHRIQSDSSLLRVK